MTRTSSYRPTTAVALGLALLSLAACSSSSAKAKAASTPSASRDAAITISTRTDPTYGTVLVNGEGRTLYLLTSEHNGMFTCTDGNGCTKVWPDTELPKGVTKAIAGSGINASLLGTRQSGDATYVTYNGWPVYEYAGDTGAGDVNGQGITSFGGTWWVISATGNPVTKKQSAPGGSSSSSGGYNY